MEFVITTFNWRGTGRAHCEKLNLNFVFQDMVVGETKTNLRYAITRIA